MKTVSTIRLNLTLSRCQRLSYVSTFGVYCVVDNTTVLPFIAVWESWRFSEMGFILKLRIVLNKNTYSCIQTLRIYRRGGFRIWALDFVQKILCRQLCRVMGHVGRGSVVQWVYMCRRQLRFHEVTAVLVLFSLTVNACVPAV